MISLRDLLNSRLCFVLFFVIFITHNIFSQQLAFPSAYGAGAYTSGGRGGSIYHVTNLNDNGVGSLRDAVSQPNRIIVFDVSGVIQLNNLLGFSDNLTIAGQTAPEGGITIDGDRVYLSDANNLVVRYIRFKGGTTDDSFTSADSTTNQIFDHCSFSYGLDESATWYGTGSGNGLDNVDKLTIQNCLFSESVKGVIIGAQGSNSNTSLGDVSIIKNVFYNVSYRVPNVANSNGTIEVINNLSWNNGTRLIQLSGEGNLNHINNYYNYGSTAISDTRLFLHSDNGLVNEIYTNGNKITANGFLTPLANTVAEINANNKLGWRYFVGDNYGGQLPPNYFTDSPHNIYGRSFAHLSADEVLQQLPSNVGCNARLNADGGISDNLDVEDEISITNIQNGNYVPKISSLNYNVNPIVSVSRPSNFYQSNPHIPEAYLTVRGIIGNPEIHNEIQSSGYTLIEEYLNEVDGPPQGNVEATGVELTPNVATINVSETLLLSTQFTPVNTTDQTGVWTSENDAIASVDANGLATGNSEGSVEIRFVSNDGSFTATSQITVIPLPLIAGAGDDQTICEGQEIQLTAEEAPSYLWSTGETTQSINVSPIITTIYTLTVTNGNSTEIDEVTVFVDSMPDLTVSEDVSIVEGDNIELSATGANAYLWSTGETTSSITVSPLESTTYNVIGTNGVCEVSKNVTVTVEPVLNVDLGDDQQICEGSGESIILDAGNGDTYLWNTGETTQTISVDPVSTSTYSVTVTSGIQQDTDSITIFVDPNPNVVILNGDSVDILNGDFVTLSATGANTYEWNNGATQPNIAVSPAQTTIYEVRGYINECYDEKQVVVNVIPEVEADAGDDVEICLGETVLLTATGGDEYAWSNGEITQSIEVSPTETTEYTVTVFNALDFDEDSVVVNVISDCEESIEEPDPTVNSDEPFEFTFDVFPNPTSNYVDVRIAGIENLARIYIYDMMGKLIYQKRVQNGSANVSSISRFDMSKLIPGIYYIQFQNLEKTMAKKLLVQ